MNPQAIIDNFKKTENESMKNYRDKINNNNITEKIKTVIDELTEKRQKYYLGFASSYNSPYGQGMYGGQILTTNVGPHADIQKSIEYEVLLSSILEFIKK